MECVTDCQPVNRFILSVCRFISRFSWLAASDRAPNLPGSAAG